MLLPAPCVCREIALCDQHKAVTNLLIRFSDNRIAAEVQRAVAERDRELGEVIGWDSSEKDLLQALKDEWHDFMLVCHHCSVIYDAASGGRISKPLTLPAQVIAQMEDRESRDIDEAVKEAVAEEREACAKVADTYPQRDPAEDGNGYWAAEEIAAAIRARQAGE